MLRYAHYAHITIPLQLYLLALSGPDYVATLIDECAVLHSFGSRPLMGKYRGTWRKNRPSPNISAADSTTIEHGPYCLSTVRRPVQFAFSLIL